MFINPSLENIQRVLALRGSPQDSFRSILVAGTNGKGSVCTFLELLYLRLKPEFQIGKYISPHLLSICERFSINGTDIKQVDFDRYWHRFIDECPETQSLTEFEKETLFAFEYFKDQNVDIAILEVGLGGLWDATNTVSSEQILATAITNIGMDHMEYLGNSLAEIKSKKEGIIRDSVPHFNGYEIEASQSNPNAELGANFLLACRIFEKLNKINIPELIREEVLRKFSQRYRARLEYNTTNRILIDIAHNEDSMRNLNIFIKENLDHSARRIFVIGMLDKDYKTCLQRLFDRVIDPMQDLVIICEPNNPRKTPAESLANSIHESFPSIQTKIIKEPSAALDYAYKQKNNNDYLIITGTSSIMKEV